MPTKKKSRSTTAKKSVKKPVPVRKPQVSSSQGASYDTMMIITILLLLFVYPLGLVFMWALMRTWPTWLKIVITLPLLIALFFTALVVFVVGQSVRHIDWNKVRMQQQYEQMRERQQNMMNISPTPSSPYTF